MGYSPYIFLDPVDNAVVILFSVGIAALVWHQTGIVRGDTEATLTGETLHGQAITGTESIKTVGRKKK